MWNPTTEDFWHKHLNEDRQDGNIFGNGHTVSQVDVCIYALRTHMQAHTHTR